MRIPTILTLLLSNAPVTAAYADRALALAPTLYMPLDETSGTSILDYSGNALNGTAANLTLADATSPAGTDAPAFNGTSSNITIAHDALLMPTEITAAMWIKSPDYSGAFRIILMKNDDGNWLSGYGFHVAGGTSLRFWINNYLNFAGVAMPGTDWFHVAATYDGANILFYLDGELVNTKATAAGINANTGSLTLGSDPTPGFWYQGNMAHVFIKNAVLTAEQIAILATP